MKDFLLLEFSPNEVYSWNRTASKVAPLTNSQAGAEKYADLSRNIVFLRESCQIVKPVSPRFELAFLGKSFLILTQELQIITEVYQPAS